MTINSIHFVPCLVVTAKIKLTRLTEMGGNKPYVIDRCH